MLRRLGDRGEGSLSYLTVILLVASVTAVVSVVTVGDKVAAGLRSGVCRVSQGEDCGGPGDDPQASGSSSPSPGASGSTTAPAGGETPEEREYREALAELNEANSDAQSVEDEWNNFDLLEEIAELGLDFIAGDIIDCIEDPSLMDCLWAIVSVVPWTKITKVLRSIPKIARLIDRYLDLKRRLERARQARRDARDRLDDALEACNRKKNSNSFTAGTPVLMADGTRKPIEQVRVGDTVWATDPATARSGPRTVTARITGTGTKHLVDLTIDPDATLGGPTATITATVNHPFWVPGTGDWIDGGELFFGDELATVGGRDAMVVDRHRYKRTETVYNLTVEGLHTYYVGSGGTGILVHNDPTPDPDACDLTPPKPDYETPANGTPEYERRVNELAQDPSHQGTVGAKAIREAEVGLELERRGVLPGPIQRAPKINGKDTGEFVDANGQHWDVKAWADTFPAGPNKGQPMPPGTRGRYDRATVENQIRHELSQSPSENVIVDPQNMSPEALADVRQLVASHPEWNGKVVFL
ncbi:polymorphic toxin-type HINT domain-containing protein [Actinomadura sp. B10D3]|uniref:polymorphic toxin-type HINT domain-containing protein n=1 Tax=Actinomadura sp. B10D3 TaxID=3153557 RepID=UPI00325F7F91